MNCFWFHIHCFAARTTCLNQSTHPHRYTDSGTINQRKCLCSAWFVELTNFQVVLCNFEIVRAQFANYWPKLDASPNLTLPLTPILTLARLHASTCKLYSSTKCVHLQIFKNWLRNSISCFSSGNLSLSMLLVENYPFIQYTQLFPAPPKNTLFPFSKLLLIPPSGKPQRLWFTCD